MYSDKILSIIIPTYNAEKYLDKGLSSLILEERDLFERLEVLVINDGSPDGSRDIALKYVQEYPQIFRLIDKENGGHGSGINVGAKEARGVYFKVLDADDWVDRDGFKRYMNELRNIVDIKEISEAPDVIVTPYEEFDISSGKTKQLIAMPKEYYRNYSMGEIMDQWQMCHMDLHFWGITYRTSFYQALRYQLAEGVFYEDQEYATIPASYAKLVQVFDTMVYVYRVGDVNQSVFGDTQVKRRSHLETVLERLLAQQSNLDKMPIGGARYWKKKTSMVVTSYYQIMLLKNKDKKMGRKAVREASKMIASKSPEIYAAVQKKKKVFVIFSYLHVSNKFYERVAPKILKLVRRVRGQNV